MLNLLKPEQKKQIIHEYHVRFFVLVFVMLFCVEVLAVILLLPSYLTSKARSDALNSKSSILQAQSISEQGAALNDLIKKTNDYIGVFLASATSTSVSAALHAVVDNRGNAVKINGLVYSVQNGVQQITVQGVAASRQDLLDFIKRLKQQKGVLSANLPLSDFSQAQNITFSLVVIESLSNS